MQRTKFNTNSSTKDNKDTIQTLRQKVNTLSTLVQRNNWATTLGMQYGTDRDLYQALGYPTELKYEDYYARYKRQDIAKAIIKRPVKVTWRGDIVLEENDKKVEETKFEKQWKVLEKTFKLKSTFIKVDKLTGIGQYGVLVLGLSDIKDEQGLQQPVVGKTLKLIYVKAVSEKNAVVSTWEDNTANPRYGKPVLYDVNIVEPSSSVSKTIKVHYTRIVHIMEDALESEVNGTPRLEAVYNRLMDLEKLTGGSAEMYWRGARGGYHGAISPDFKRTPEMEEDLQDQLDEYEHNLRRFLVTEGIDIKSLDQQLSDPKNSVDIQIQMISAETGIPKRILTGSERGELSSSQDQDEYSAYIQSRREEFAEPAILRPFIDMCMLYGILPAVEYTVRWEDLFAKSEKEKAEIGRIRSAALKEYASTPMVEGVIPVSEFLYEFLGFDEETIERIEEARKQELLLEPPVTDEEETIIEEEEEETKTP